MISYSSEGIDVRRAVVGDAQELVRLRHVMLVAVEGLDPTRNEWHAVASAQLCARLADNDDSFVAFVVDSPGLPGKLAACAVGLVEHRLVGPSNPTGEIGYIVNVVTDPTFRRRGYSRACMATLLGWYTGRGIARIDLRASAAGEPLYRALGFVPPPLPTMQLTLGH
jgi:GNAT superfamily N-acetyltransferase